MRGLLEKLPAWLFKVSGARDAFILGALKREVNAKNARNEYDKRISAALWCITCFGGIDGAHHKQWCLDQVVRILKAEQYEDWVEEFEDGEDGSDTYSWDEGIAP
jgi:hypothetical protein